MKLYSSREHETNHDPFPYVGQHGSRHAYAGTLNGAPLTHDPRPAYAHVQHNGANPLLVAFRDYCVDAAPEAIAWSASLWLNLLDDADPSFDASRTIDEVSGRMAEWERLLAQSHLVRVLTRIERFAEMAVPA